MPWKFHKIKQFGLVFMKLLVVSLAVFLICKKLFGTQNNGILWENFISEQKLPFHFWVFLLFFTFCNWFFEIKKWQILASVIQPVKFQEAVKQSLASHTVAIITPNRIGEYGAKSLFYPKNHWKKILLLNFFGNIAQLSATIIFGIVGMAYLMDYLNFSNQKILMFCGILSFILLILYFLRWKKWNIKFFSSKKWLRISAEISISSKWKVFVFSILRYLVFSHQFYLILIFLGAEIGYFNAISAIFCVYLFASALPSIFIFEALIKGSVALWIFSFFQINEILVLTSVGLMWIFSFAFPAVIGSYFVLKFQPEKKLAI